MRPGRGRLRQTAPGAQTGADCRAPNANCAACPAPALAAGWCVVVGGFVGVRPRRFGSAPPSSRAARKPGSRQPPQKRGGRPGRPALQPCRPAGVGSPAAVPGVPIALFPATICGAPSRARRGVGRAVRPGRRAVVLLCCVPAAAKAPVFSARGAGYEKTPRAKGNAPAGARGLRRLRAA